MSTVMRPTEGTIRTMLVAYYQRLHAGIPVDQQEEVRRRMDELLEWLHECITEECDG